jgi:teichuronic acid biosynthesis glycosyltransferase TuaC
MNVLFVSRETREHSISSIVFNQGESLKSMGIDVKYFRIKGKGLWGYFRSIFALRAFLNKNDFTLVHAHYSLSGFVAALAGSRPLVVSLMGSDIHCHDIYRNLIDLFASQLWSGVIVKSEAMKSKLRMDSAHVIANGVDIDKFQPFSQLDAKQRVGFNGNKNIIFVGNPDRSEKNFKLAEEALALLKDENIAFQIVSQQPHEKLPDYMNAADVLLLTSKYEGSPNVVKEAMACNCPIVATDVGDIRWVIGDTAGCFLAEATPEDVALKIRKALAFNGRTKGRQRLIDLGLDSGSTAKRIINIYEGLIHSPREPRA